MVAAIETKPTVRNEVADVLAWLDDHEHNTLEAQSVEVTASGVRVVFSRECHDAFLECFKGTPAKLHRGGYGTNWYVVKRGRWEFQCYTPKAPETEDVTL